MPGAHKAPDTVEPSKGPISIFGGTPCSVHIHLSPAEIARHIEASHAAIEGLLERIVRFERYMVEAGEKKL
jgi:hypothetical protein